MKKYWKIIMITVVTFLSIGTFYVHSSIAAIELPEFVIENQSGDKSLVESLVIDGSFNQNPLFKSLQITSTGTVYNSELSFFEKFGSINQPIIGELIEEHRNFMRGKNKYIYSFYEDERFLVYAGVNYKTRALSSSDFKFAISILDKNEGDSRSYELSIPNASGFNYVSILDVQKIAGELKIITNNFTDGSEIHIYTVDTKTKTVIADETIISIASKRNGYSNVELIEENNPKQAHEIVVFKQTVLEEIEDNDQVIERNDGPSEYRPESMNMKEINTLIAYNLTTKEKKTIRLPQELEVSGQENPIQAFDGSNLYFVNINNNQIWITPYNVKSEKIGNIVSLPFSSNKDGFQNPVVIVHNGNVYTLSDFLEEESAATLTVTDLISRETLYKGQVAEENPDPNESKYELSIYNMTVR